MKLTDPKLIEAVERYERETGKLIADLVPEMRDQAMVELYLIMMGYGLDRKPPPSVLSL